MYDVRKSLVADSLRNLECVGIWNAPRMGDARCASWKNRWRRVFRRLRFQRFVTALVWTWAIALFIVAALIGAEKLLNQHIPGPDWLPFAVAGLVGIVVAAGSFTSLRPEPDGCGGGTRPGFSFE